MKAATTNEKKCVVTLLHRSSSFLRFQFFFLTALLRNTRKRKLVKSTFITYKVKCSKNKRDERGGDERGEMREGEMREGEMRQGR